jgi:hypothetical protein
MIRQSKPRALAYKKVVHFTPKHPTRKVKESTPKQGENEKFAEGARTQQYYQKCITL